MVPDGEYANAAAQVDVATVAAIKLEKHSNRQTDRASHYVTFCLHPPREATQHANQPVVKVRSFASLTELLPHEKTTKPSVPCGARVNKREFSKFTDDRFACKRESKKLPRVT